MNFAARVAGGFESGGRAIAQFMNAAMDVGVVVLVIIAQRLDDCARLLRGRGVIEINQRMAMDLLIQDRKIGAQCSPIDLASAIRLECTGAIQSA